MGEVAHNLRSLIDAHRIANDPELRATPFDLHLQAASDDAQMLIKWPNESGKLRIIECAEVNCERAQGVTSSPRSEWAKASVIRTSTISPSRLTGPAKFTMRL